MEDTFRSFYYGISLDGHIHDLLAVLDVLHEIVNHARPRAPTACQIIIVVAEILMNLPARCLMEQTEMRSGIQR